MFQTKVTYVNGLAFQGKIDASQDLVIDFGSGEVKVLARDKETGLFEDFNKVKHAYCAERAWSIISKLVDIGGVVVNVKKMNAKIADESRGDPALFAEISERLKGEGVPVYATGVWREMEHANVTSLLLEEELTLTALSASINNSGANLLINGSMKYTADAYKFGFDGSFALDNLKGMVDTLLREHAFTEADVSKNNPNLGRLIAVLSKASEGEFSIDQKIYIISGTSSLGLVVQKDTGFETVLGVEENISASLLKAFKAKVDEKFGDIKAKSTFQILSSALLTKMQLDANPQSEAEIAALKADMSGKLEVYLDDFRPLTKAANSLLGNIHGKHTVKITRIIEVDHEGLVPYTDNLSMTKVDDIDEAAGHAAAIGGVDAEVSE